MLRVAWRTLSLIRTQAVTQALVPGLPGGGSAKFPFNQWGLQPRSLLLQAARGYVIRKPAQSRLDDDPPPSTLLKDYQNVPGIEKVDDVVKRLLSLEMANKKEMLKIKQEQFMKKIVANPEDTRSLEARIIALSVKIRSYEEHLEKHRKDKAHKRYLLMSIDQRKKMLKNLRNTNYDVFEKICLGLGIEYTFPPLYYRRAHRRFVTKKALCIRVFQETQKLKKRRRALKAAAAAQKQAKRRNPDSPAKAIPKTLKDSQ
ncbi:small ribosomal subunit protein uS15m [Pan paniscus]|uniref:Small ribosomal subunit protein uS15m n=1 Tax=Pan paniscus TaxID=9597 RepID=A0A2R8ZVI4_PANPA|nr:28S ribosomal protein S15, mitochondrial [Pan paniscus]XP_524665.3 28S ribosomal protein S15, mitochondrial [Pan troglodytes]